jgi:hypothetical protein
MPFVNCIIHIFKLMKVVFYVYRVMHRNTVQMLLIILLMTMNMYLIYVLIIQYYQAECLTF